MRATVMAALLVVTSAIVGVSLGIAQERPKTTFTATLSFDAEAVRAFAVFLGWKEYVHTGPVISDDNIQPNPQTPEAFIAEAFKEYSYGFTTRYAQHLKEETFLRETATLRKQLDDELVEPIKNATVVTYETP